jgi:hypothetical protein
VYPLLKSQSKTSRPLQKKALSHKFWIKAPKTSCAPSSRSESGRFADRNHFSSTLDPFQNRNATLFKSKKKITSVEKQSKLFASAHWRTVTWPWMATTLNSIGRHGFMALLYQWAHLSTLMFPTITAFVYKYDIKSITCQLALLPPFSRFGESSLAEETDAAARSHVIFFSCLTL